MKKPIAPLLLFDGVCNLCNAGVDFIIRRDGGRVFRFASLQSEAGQTALKQAGMELTDWDSLVLVEGDRVSTHSTAVLRIARHLGWPWRAAYVLIVIPRALRDAAYRFIAHRRYRWFGRRETCRVPTAAEREQFVADAPPGGVQH